MASRLKSILKSIPVELRKTVKKFFNRSDVKKLGHTMISEEVADDFLLILLKVMGLFTPIFRNSMGLDNFHGRYLFEAGDKVDTYIEFKDRGIMKVLDKAPEGYDWDVKVKFKDSKSLRSFLIAGNMDILDAVLKNKINVEGNLTYIYRFGFIVTDLLRHLGLLNMMLEKDG